MPDPDEYEDEDLAEDPWDDEVDDDENDGLDAPQGAIDDDRQIGLI